MAAILIIAGVAAFYFWIGAGSNRSPTTSHEWRTYQEVGTTPDGVQIVVEADYTIDTLNNQFTMTEPTPDKWAFRASQIAGGVVSPFSGQTKPLAFTIWGKTASTEAIPDGQWGVPLNEAYDAAQSRMDSSTQGGGPISPTAPDGNAPSQDLDLDADGFPQQSMDSFTGTPISLGDSTDITTSTSITTRGLTSTEELGLI